MKYLQKSFLFRFYNARTDAEQIVILCSLFSVGLMTFRIIYTGHLLFAFLVWNLFLAYVPYAISKQMSLRSIKMKWEFLLYSFIWLLFIPNSFYIITDLFHLDMNEDVPLWYDLALLLSFAWNGLLFGILSVRQMEKLFEKNFNKKFGALFIVPVMALNGFGVYIGRYLRFNSWDVLANPFQLINDIIYMFIHPIRNRFDWSMIVCYTLLLTLMYYTMKKLSKVL
ncbi:MAG TPA: DUF1361 domain-containing protein [Flavisolibacter sp.]|jgi:uncharacterized membrane protein|nr:DUF1361 domain-containing protein [Flavisolibacter sp.]